MNRSDGIRRFLPPGRGGAVFRAKIVFLAHLCTNSQHTKTNTGHNLQAGAARGAHATGPDPDAVRRQPMVGRYGGDDPTPLAAVSFGGAVVFFILFIAAVGIALRHDAPRGRTLRPGRPREIGGPAANGILFYGLLGRRWPSCSMPPSRCSIISASPPKWSIWPSPYYKMLVYSMPFIMLFFTFKQFLEGVGNTKVEMAGHDRRQSGQHRLQLGLHLRPLRIPRDGRRRRGPRHAAVAHHRPRSE